MHQAEIDLLVLAAQDGNAAAFGRLVRHFDAPLRRFAYSVGADAELAHDAVQEAWLTVARSLRRLDDVRAFRSWLFRAVRWKVLDRLRQPASRELPLDAVEAEALLDDREPVVDDGDGLRTAPRQLPAIDRQALQLFYLQEMSVAEVALALDVPAGTVKSRLNRARKQLKQHLTNEGVSP